MQHDSHRETHWSGRSQRHGQSMIVDPQPGQLSNCVAAPTLISLTSPVFAVRQCLLHLAAMIDMTCKNLMQISDHGPRWTLDTSLLEPTLQPLQDPPSSHH